MSPALLWWLKKTSETTGILAPQYRSNALQRRRHPSPWAPPSILRQGFLPFGLGVRSVGVVRSDGSVESGGVVFRKC